MRPLAIILGLVLLASAPADAQATRPASSPTSGPKGKGTADILKKALAEHAEAAFRKTKETLARAEQIDKSLLELDWSEIDVPAVAFEFWLIKRWFDDQDRGTDRA